MGRFIFIIFVCFFIANTGNAQFFKALQPDDSFSDSLNKIVLDYKNNFHSLEKNQLQSGEETEVYRSKTCLPDARHCSVTQYHSAIDTTASWQAVMYDGENYKEALKLYKNTFSLVKKSAIAGIDKSNVYFKGKLENISESIGFAVSSLRLITGNPQYSNLCAEVELTQNYSGWQVHLSLMSKKADTEE